MVFRFSSTRVPFKCRRTHRFVGNEQRKQPITEKGVGFERGLLTKGQDEWESSGKVLREKNKLKIDLFVALDHQDFWTFQFLWNPFSENTSFLQIISLPAENMLLFLVVTLALSSSAMANTQATYHPPTEHHHRPMQSRSGFGYVTLIMGRLLFRF